MAVDGLTDDRGPQSVVGGPVSLVVEYEGDDIRREVSRTALEKGWGLLEIRSVEPTLEDIYLKLIHESGGAQEE